MWWPFKKKKIEDTEEVLSDDEIFDNDYPDGALEVKFIFRKKGISYELDTLYNYNYKFIETLRQTYNINEASDQVAIDKFLSLGLILMDTERNK